MARKKELMEEFEAKGLPSPQTRSFIGHKLVQGQPVVAV